MRRILVEVLTDGAGHGQTQIGVDVDLADRSSGSLTQLLLRNTNGIGHLAAMLIDHLHILLRYGRRTVQNDGEAGQSLGDFLQNVETQGRRNQLALLVAGALICSELVSAVGGADGNSQGIAAGTGHKFLNLFGTGIMRPLGGYIHIILDAGQSAQLSLYYYAMSVSIFYDLLGDGDILLKGLGGGVDHDGGETIVDTGFAGLKAVAVIQMQNDRQAGLDNGSLSLRKGKKYLIILPSTRLIPRNPIYIRKYTNTLPVNSPMPMSSLLNQPAKIKKKPSLSAA